MIRTCWFSSRTPIGDLHEGVQSLRKCWRLLVLFFSLDAGIADVLLDGPHEKAPPF